MVCTRETAADGNTESDEDPLILRSSTLTALTAFLDEQAVALEAMAFLTAQSSNSPNYSSIQPDDTANPESTPSQPSMNEAFYEDSDHLTCGPDQANPQLQIQTLPVDEFKRVFKENWQLSQFWYTQDTARRLTKALRKTCPIDAHIAFVCCPTGYVAFKEASVPTQKVHLLEYDRRFSIVAGADFVHYDLDEPLSFPRAEALRGSQDMVVVDPPFHSEMSQKKVASTVAHILRPGGRLVLLTGLNLLSLVDNIYPSPPFPKLTRRAMIIEHDGLGRLETPYGCWVSASEEQADREKEDAGFGEVIGAES